MEVVLDSFTTATATHTPPPPQESVDAGAVIAAWRAAGRADESAAALRIVLCLARRGGIGATEASALRNEMHAQVWSYTRRAVLLLYSNTTTTTDATTATTRQKTSPFLTRKTTIPFLTRKKNIPFLKRSSV